jgi:hypothetical protein
LSLEEDISNPMLIIVSITIGLQLAQRAASLGVAATAFF